LFVFLQEKLAQELAPGFINRLQEANFALFFVRFFAGLPTSGYKICLAQNKI